MRIETPPKPPSRLLAKLIASHRAVATLLLNTVVLFVLINALLYIVLTLRAQYLLPRPTLDLFSEKALAAVYPGLSRQEVKTVLDENWSRPMGYEDYVMYKERPYRGKYVNVSEAGFRQVKDQGSWPPSPVNLNVFVFGGSTMFGYGVADDQTVASYLQEILTRSSKKQVCVYNFGTGFYHSTQERILFERLATRGCRPDLAIFVDGLNDFWRLDDTPVYNETMAAAFDRSPLVLLLQKLPMVRILRKVTIERSPQSSTSGLQERAHAVVQRYQRHLKMLEAACRASGTTPLFVWQPVPTYKYDTKYHLFLAFPHNYDIQVAGYVEMEQLYKTGALGTNFLWCADLQQSEKECLYVDSHHYSAKFSRKFAEAVCRQGFEAGVLQGQGLIPAAPQK